MVQYRLYQKLRTCRTFCCLICCIEINKLSNNIDCYSNQEAWSVWRRKVGTYSLSLSALIAVHFLISPPLLPFKINKNQDNNNHLITFPSFATSKVLNTKFNKNNDFLSSYLYPDGKDQNPDLTVIQHEKQKKVIQVTEEEYEIYTSMGSTFQQCKVCQHSSLY